MKKKYRPQKPLTKDDLIRQVEENKEGSLGVELGKQELKYLNWLWRGQPEKDKELCEHCVYRKPNDICSRPSGKCPIILLIKKHQNIAITSMVVGTIFAKIIDEALKEHPEYRKSLEDFFNGGWLK